MDDNGRVELIDKAELIEVLMRSDCSDRQKIYDIVAKQPVIAFAYPRYEIVVVA
ncbi:MAG: hypothetical protein J6S50_04850 [Oscillospiraceae bacterium]|nr:hypothetical protein [Oscillospiraceae bacterium]